MQHAWSAYWLSIANRMRGDRAAAARWLDQAEEIFTMLDSTEVTLCLRERAELLRAEGRPDEAVALLVRVLAQARSAREHRRELGALHTIGLIVGETDPVHGAEMLTRAADLARDIGAIFAVDRIESDLVRLRGPAG
jgi:hypothetical protein